MLGPAEHLSQGCDRLELHRRACASAIECMVVGVERHRQCVGRARYRMWRFGHLAGVQRMAGGVVGAAPLSRLAENCRSVIAEHRRLAGRKLRKARVELLLRLAQTQQEFNQVRVALHQYWRKTLTVSTVSKPNFKASPASVASTAARAVHGAALRIRLRAASISRITTSRTAISTMPSQTKTRVPSGVTESVCCSLGCREKLPTANARKNNTNCNTVKTAFFIGIDSREIRLLDVLVRRLILAPPPKSTAGVPGYGVGVGA